MPSTTKIAIAGVGYWGTNLLRTFARVPQARVTDLCDLDATRLAKLRDEHPGIQLSDDFDALLRRDDIDAVIVATPPSRHHTMALKALRAGKHVWVEKPLALSMVHGRELVDAARAAD